MKNKEIGDRLKKLRIDNGYSQTELFRKVKKVRNKEEEIIIIDDDAGKQTISQLERGVRSLTVDMAKVYAEIFNVSLDYIYNDEKPFKPEYEDIKNILGLSDEAINKIEFLNNNNKDLILMLDKLLNPELSNHFIDLLKSLNNHREIYKKYALDKNRGIINYVPMFENRIIKEYEDNKNFKTNLKDIEDASFLNIVRVISRITDNCKDGGK